ncbi:MAG: Na(+)-translocating NADH-quinone reductase subunit C [Porticoccaceae bacterium]
MASENKKFNKDSVFGTVLVAFGVCLVCAIVVSTAAVALKPLQQTNIERDRQSNILAAAGLLEEGVSVEEQFESVQTRVVDLRTGQFTDEVDPATYDHLRAAKGQDRSTGFDNLDTRDIAQIGRRENYSVVYLIDDADGNLDKVILPIRGYGLWSTMQGFIALEEDMTTVAGIGFFAHKETPGLGGEIDNPNWKQNWVGKEVYESGELALEVIKGSVDPDNPNAEHRVDGLAGATLTTRGVDNLIQFWLGEYGFKDFLTNLKEGRA